MLDFNQKDVIVNSTLLNSERPAGSPYRANMPESTAEPARSVAPTATLTHDLAAEQHQAAAARRSAQLVARQARREHEALRAAHQSTLRLF